MRRVEAKPIQEYLFSGRVETIGIDDAPLLFRIRQLFAPTPLIFGFSVLLLLTSVASRFSQIGMCTVATYGIYIYLRTRAIAQGLFVR